MKYRKLLAQEVSPEADDACNDFGWNPECLDDSLQILVDVIVL